MIAVTATPATCRVPGGTFLMGSATGRDDERPVRPATVAPFRMARTPVTRAQYAEFLGDTVGPVPEHWDTFAGDALPVVAVTWFEACAYADWLSRAHGERWRLPTEAEWECAARGGLTQAPTPWGDAIPPGEIPDGPLDGPWAVGQGTPNGFGLCDMGTIVHEWCLDWYEEETRGPVRRASRGGSWRHRVRFSPPAARSSLPPTFRYTDYGFRVLREEHT